MAPFDRAMNWLQMEAAQDPVIAPMGGAGNGGGNGSPWLNYGQPPAAVPNIPGSPLGLVDVGGGPQQAFQTQTFVPTGSGIPPNKQNTIQDTYSKWYYRVID